MSEWLLLKQKILSENKMILVLFLILNIVIPQRMTSLALSWHLAKK